MLPSFEEANRGERVLVTFVGARCLKFSSFRIGPATGISPSATSVLLTKSRGVQHMVELSRDQLRAAAQLRAR